MLYLLKLVLEAHWLVRECYSATGVIPTNNRNRFVSYDSEIHTQNELRTFYDVKWTLLYFYAKSNVDRIDRTFIGVTDTDHVDVVVIRAFRCPLKKAVL